MTAEEMLEAVNTALAASLDAAYWAAVVTATQTAAVTMATADVLAQLPGVQLDAVPDEAGPVVLAVAEQAVFLVRTHDEQAEGKVLTGEGVQGLSASYTLINAANAGLSPRAAIYIKQAKRQALSGCRFSRG